MHSMTIHKEILGQLPSQYLDVRLEWREGLVGELDARKGDTINVLDHKIN